MEIKAIVRFTVGENKLHDMTTEIQVEETHDGEKLVLEIPVGEFKESVTLNKIQIITHEDGVIYARKYFYPITITPNMSLVLTCRTIYDI